MSADDKLDLQPALASARAAIAGGDPQAAVTFLLSVSYKHAKDPDRLKLLQQIYRLIEFPIDEATWTPECWQRRLLFELYSYWPRLKLQNAILKHSFPEPALDDYAVSGAESVQLAYTTFEWFSKKPVALSRGRYKFKVWDLETGEVIHARELGLELLSSAIGRDSSHLLFGDIWHHPETSEIHWSTAFMESFRRIRTGRGGPFRAPEGAEVRHYKVNGEINRVTSGSEIEVDRQEFEKHPVCGEILRPRDFKERTPRLIEYIRETRSPEEAEEYFREDDLARQREKEIVRVRLLQTITIEHDVIEGYLPAGTTTFAAPDGWLDFEPKISDLWSGPITATVAVVGDEAWLEDVVVPGHTLRALYYPPPTTPITAVCISSDGSLGFRNGNGEFFGIWNLWTGDCLREFHGHSDRVTCLCPSVDVSLVVSGSEDKTLRLWKPVTAECVRMFAGHEYAITKICLSLDASRILSADTGGAIKLWDTATGECLRTIHAHRDRVSGLYLGYDGRFAASSSWDQTVKLWNLSDGSCMQTLDFDDWATSVDMTPDGKYLVASSYEGTRVWELVWELESRDFTEWDEAARPILEILLNANAAWDGKLGTCIDMTEEEKRETLRRQGPSWTAWHTPSKKNDWHRIWHLDWDINAALGHAGLGWVTEAGREGSRIIDARREARSAAADSE
ncbi:MAG TPA: WD40 repeat domain-containing protein [Pyrinomonadaceae bacterium]|jgi:WD40 repeat protein